MKIAVIGAGNVGASIAYALTLKGVASQIALVDRFKDVARAKAIDISQASCVFDGLVSVTGSDSYEILKGFDIVVITAGSPRKDGQTREDLLLKNALIVKEVAQNIAKYAPNAIMIVVTNPLDAMMWVAKNASGFDNRRVIGMAGELDSARCRFESANVLNLSPDKITASVIGAHNDNMIVSAKNITPAPNANELKKIAHETKTGGAKIVKLLGTSAYYAPAAAVVKMCEAISGKTDKFISASVLINDELASGRMIKLDKSGVSEILTPDLTSDELSELEQSEREITANIRYLKENL